MTLTELTKYLNKKGHVLCIGMGSIVIPVQVKDVRKIFDRIELLVVPLEGEGEAWVAMTRVALEGEAP